MKILGTGLTGLVGSRIVELLSRQHQFENISRSTGVDIINREQVCAAIKRSDANIVLHLAAKANVDACERDKALGEAGEAWKINVVGTKNVVDACKETNKKIVFISTDFIFSGENTPAEGYSEEDQTGPVNWYAKTKDEAEKIIKNSGVSYRIIRIAFPYTYFDEKVTFVSAIYNRLKTNQSVAAITDEMFTPTWLDDLVEGIDFLLQKNVIGIYHIGGGNTVTPEKVAQQIADVFGYDKSLIYQTTREKYFSGKARRPFNTSLRSDKITQLGLPVTTFAEGLKMIKNRQHG